MKKTFLIGLIIALVIGPSAFCSDTELVQSSPVSEKGIVRFYKAIENSVVSGYKAIENGVVNGYKAVESFFVNTFLASTNTADERIIEIFIPVEYGTQTRRDN